MQFNQDKTKKILFEPKYLNVFAVLIFLGIVLIGYFFLDSFSKNVNERHLEVAAKEQELKTREENIEKYENIKSKVKDFPNKVEILDTIQEDQQSIEQLIAQLEKISDAAGLKMPTLAPDDKIVGSLGSSISISGDYASMKKFLNALENNQLILNIKDISISGNEPDLTATITLTTSNAASIDINTGATNYGP